ncbi:MAG: glucose 1-dehydrogenase [Bryobacteraceae bacterium]
MKAVAVFPLQKKVELVNHPEPGSLAADQVRIRVLEVGICGTDREIATYEYGLAPKGSEYLVLGHESLGEVLETGRAVARVKPGDLVIPTVRRSCPERCAACAAGRQDFCYTGHYRERGIVADHGFLTETIVEQEANLNLVPSTLRDIAVLTEPLTVTEKAFDQVAAIQSRLSSIRPRQAVSGQIQRAVVLGAGPVGLLAAMKFRAEGYEVWVYSRGSEAVKPPIVSEFGGHFIDSESVSPAELGSLCGQIDVIYEAMGGADVAFKVLEQLGHNGVFVFTGIPRHSHPVPLNTSSLLYNLVLKNQVVCGTVNAAPCHFQRAIADLALFRTLFPDAVRKLITNRFPIERFNEPLSTNAGIKNVIAVSTASCQ